MKLNTAKQKMLRGEPTFGYAAKLGSPAICEFLTQSGADFITVDNQHGSWGPETTVQAFSAICTGPAMPFARVSINSYTRLGQLLDAGAMGVIVPLIDTPEQARQVAAACRYPPVGDRSYGWGRAAAYGDDYADWINDQLYVAVQIESATAAENAEAIMAVPGIDGCMVGPADLAMSMGFHPRDALKRDDHARLLERVVQACHNTGKIPGIDTGVPEQAALRVQQGFVYVSIGADVRFLMNGARAGLKLAREGK